MVPRLPESSRQEWMKSFGKEEPLDPNQEGPLNLILEGEAYKTGREQTKDCIYRSDDLTVLRPFFCKKKV